MTGTKGELWRAVGRTRKWTACNPNKLARSSVSSKKLHHVSNEYPKAGGLTTSCANTLLGGKDRRRHPHSWASGSGFLHIDNDSGAFISMSTRVHAILGLEAEPGSSSDPLERPPRVEEGGAVIHCTPDVIGNGPDDLARRHGTTRSMGSPRTGDISHAPRDLSLFHSGPTAAARGREWETPPRIQKK